MVSSSDNGSGSGMGSGDLITVCMLRVMTSWACSTTISGGGGGMVLGPRVGALDSCREGYELVVYVDTSSRGP